MDRETFRKIPAMLHSIGRDGRLEEVSDVWLQRLGYERDEVIGRLSTDFLTPPSAEYVRSQILPRFFGTGSCENVPYDLVTKGGSVLHALMSARSERGLDGAVLRSLAYVEDVTRERQLERFFDLSLDLLCIAGFDGYFRVINPAWATTLGFPADEILQTPFIELVHPDDRASTQGRLSVLAQGGRVVDFENRYRARSGSWIPLAWTAVRSEDDDLVYAVARNVQYRREADEERRQLRERLTQAQKFESLAVLAGGVAHDFNNILTGVLGNADLALSSQQMESPTRKYLAAIKTASMRAADLCNQMLAYSGRGRFEIVVFDLSSMVGEMAHLLEATVGKNVLLSYQLAPEEILVRGDLNQLRQVVLNLITNASEAIGDASGVVTLSTGLTRIEGESYTESVFGGSVPPGTYAFLEVSDTGIGMNLETQEKMFDPFFTTKFTGRGLGLAATLGIVRGHDGALRVYSQYGSGTRIRVLLPPSREAPAEQAPERAQTPIRAEGRVLAVDDDETARLVAEAMLTSFGLRVHTAVDGRDAVRLFRDDPEGYELVFLDMTMPHMDGRRAAREIRSSRPDIRILYTSGFNEEDAVRRFGLQGSRDFIQKPYTAAELAEALRRVLERTD